MLTRRVPIRRRVPLRRCAFVRKRRMRPQRGPDRDPLYLAWIRTLDCAVCSQSPGPSVLIEAAHTNALGPRGLSQKTSDYSAIPLCSRHHQHNRDSYHVLGESRFVSEHDIDLQQLVLALNNRFRQASERNAHRF